MVVAGMPVTATGTSGRRPGADGPANRSVGGLAWNRGAVLVALLTFASAVSTAAAAGFPPSEQVLPATTRAWASAPDAAALRERFDRSALGRLFDEPAMQNFYDALDEQRSSIAGDRMGFGITPKELSGVSGGESVVAAVEAADARGLAAGTYYLLVEPFSTRTFDNPRCE